MPLYVLGDTHRDLYPVDGLVMQIPVLRVRLCGVHRRGL